MFAPKIAKPQTKAAKSPISKLTTQHSMFVGHRLGHNPADQTLSLQRIIGNPARGATPGSSWNFSKIPVFSPDRATEPQASSALAARPLPGAIQAKLVVGQVNDPLEHEADRIADQVMRMPAPGVSVEAVPLQISRKCAACEKEDKLQKMPAGAQATSEAPGTVPDVLRSSGQPLDAATRAYFEPRFGQDFSSVRAARRPKDRLRAWLAPARSGRRTPVPWPRRTPSAIHRAARGPPPPGPRASSRG